MDEYRLNSHHYKQKIIEKYEMGKIKVNKGQPKVNFQ